MGMLVFSCLDSLVRPRGCVADTLRYQLYASLALPGRKVSASRFLCLRMICFKLFAPAGEQVSHRLWLLSLFCIDAKLALAPAQSLELRHSR
jgi:hypothetical protein